MKHQVHIVHLYPDEMNTYGDRGNLLTLVKRCQWHGLEPVVHYYHAGDTLPDTADVFLGGGGQDSAQDDIQADILRIGNQLHAFANAGVPMLMVCGTYQLFGNRFVTLEGKEIRGIGIFDIETTGGDKRLIGNLAVETDDFGALYGFENHSGKTYLGASQQPFARVTRGNGNNGSDKTEGARTHNAIGTYMHGPLLPANPMLADGLIRLALARKGITVDFAPLDDSLVDQVRGTAVHRKY